jgi:predicted nucleic acid-binding protein
VEYLTPFAGQGEFARSRAVATVKRLLSNPTMHVVSQTRDVFLRALELYANRLDKAYSLTDCISMNMMREGGLTDILTSDRHFTQEGFHVLIPKP